MEWFSKMKFPMRHVFKRIGLRRTGLVKLHKDVRQCEYEDVHILWDMLKRKEPQLNRTRYRIYWKFVDWAKSTRPFFRHGSSSA